MNPLAKDQNNNDQPQPVNNTSVTESCSCDACKEDLFPNLENYEPFYEEIYGYCDITD